MEPTRGRRASDRRWSRVDDVLGAYLSDGAERAGAVGRRYARLWESLRASTEGGKRLRPALVLAAYEGLGGDDLDTAAQVGAAFELMHTALILHDDVIDREFVRRGVPNLSGEYRDGAHTAGIPLPRAEHRGASAAIIAGDLALTACFTIIEPSRMPLEVYRRIRALLEDALFQSAAGEMLDVDYALFEDSPTVDEVVEMERLKTAAYSFEAPLAAGAVLAGASAEAVDALSGFGRAIGIAYQIVDDILGVFGDESVTGKSVLGDLREGKRTVLIAHATTTACWPTVARYLGRADLTEEQAATVRQALDECGAHRFAQDVARQYANTAWACLSSPALPDAIRDEFRDTVAEVLERVR